MSMSYPCGVTFRWLCLTLVVLLPEMAAAQEEQESCKYRDARGNCTATPPFSAKKPKPPQRIVIVSEPPGAAVWLDGQRLDKTTPLTLDKPIRSGPHALRVDLPEHVGHEQTIKVRQYGRQVFRAALKAWPTLKISWQEHEEAQRILAEIRIDGRLVRDFVWNDAIRLPPGQHHIQVTQTGYQSWEKEVELEPGTTYVENPVLTKTTGSLVIETNLMDIPVYRVPEKACEKIRPGYEVPYHSNNKDEVKNWGDVGPRQLFKPNLIPGAYCIEFFIKGLGVQRRLLSVTKNQKAYYRFELPPPDPRESVPLERFWGKWRMDRARTECTTYTTKEPLEPKLGEKCLRLGLVLQKDEHDQEDAAKSYLGACRAGSKQACELYGWFLFHGHGDPKNRSEARDFYSEACGPGLERACYARHAPNNDKSYDPSQHYSLEDSKIMPFNSLVHEAWGNLKVSSWRTVLPYKHVPYWANWNVGITAEIDWPLHTFFKEVPFLGATASDSYAMTIGWEFGVGRLYLQDQASDTIKANYTFVGEAKVKAKYFAPSNLYLAAEGVLSNSSQNPYIRVMAAYRSNCMPFGFWCNLHNKLGIELTRVPTAIIDGEPAEDKYGLLLFWSIGPSMGWVVDKLAKD